LETPIVIVVSNLTNRFVRSNLRIADGAFKVSPGFQVGEFGGANSLTQNIVQVTMGRPLGGHAEMLADG